MTIGGISIPLVIIAVVLIVVLLFIILIRQERQKQSNSVNQQEDVSNLQEDNDEVIASQIGWPKNVLPKREVSFWKAWRFWVWCMITATPTVSLSVYAVVEAGKPHSGMEGLAAGIIWLFAGLFLLIGLVGGIAYTFFIRQRVSMIGIWVGWGIGLIAFIVVGQLG